MISELLSLSEHSVPQLKLKSSLWINNFNFCCCHIFFGKCYITRSPDHIILHLGLLYTNVFSFSVTKHMNNRQKDWLGLTI